MENKNLFNDEIKEKFNRFSSRMYNLKHSLNFFLSCLEDETEPNLELICFCYILKDYFNTTKEEYNQLEKDLGVLT